MKQSGYILIALLFVSAGCATEPEEKSIAPLFEAVYLQYAYPMQYDDGEPYYPSRSTIRKAEQAAKELMKRDGWVYIPNTEDCDNIAIKISAEMQHYIVLNHPESHGKSIAIGVDKVASKDGKPHMVAKAYYAERKFVHIKNGL